MPSESSTSKPDFAGFVAALRAEASRIEAASKTTDEYNKAASLFDLASMTEDLARDLGYLEDADPDPDDEWRDRLTSLKEDAEKVASKKGGADFGESIAEKAESMLDWLEEHGELTDRQQDAIANMESGVARWLKR